MMQMGRYARSQHNTCKLLAKVIFFFFFVDNFVLIIELLLIQRCVLCFLRCLEFR